MIKTLQVGVLLVKWLANFSVYVQIFTQYDLETFRKG